MIDTTMSQPETRESPADAAGTRTTPGHPGRTLARARLSMWAAAIGLGVVVLFGWLWPALRGPAPWPIEALNYGAFAIRTLAFHLGLGIIAFSAATLFLRQWRLTLLLVPLAVFTLWVEAGWILRAVPPMASPAYASGPLESSDDAGPTVGARPDIIVYSHNAFLGRIDPDGVAENARRHDADVIVVQEAGQMVFDRLRERLGESHPHHARESQSAVYGHAVFSRLAFDEPSRAVRFAEPPSDPHPSRMNAGDGQQRVVLRVADRRLMVQNLHLLSPADPGTVAEQGRQLDGLLRSLSDEGLLDPDAPGLLLIGDFNATPRSAMHDRLRAAGLREIHATVGSGRGGSWPANVRIVPRFLSVRIDNAFVNHGVIPRFSRVLDGNGSDHRGIVVGIDLLPR